MTGAPTIGIGRLLKEEGRFFIPHHQRDYSWTQDQLEQLFQDIEETQDIGQPEYFIGLMVFMPSEQQRAFTILDGQQRLATTTIVLAAIRSWLKARVCRGVLVYLRGRRKAPLLGEEPREDGEAEARGSLSLSGEDGVLVGAERPGFLCLPGGPPPSAASRVHVYPSSFPVRLPRRVGAAPFVTIVISCTCTSHGDPALVAYTISSPAERWRLSAGNCWENQSTAACAHGSKRRS